MNEAMGKAAGGRRGGREVTDPGGRLDKLVDRLGKIISIVGTIVGIVASLETIWGSKGLDLASILMTPLWAAIFWVIFLASVACTFYLVATGIRNLGKWNPKNAVVFVIYVIIFGALTYSAVQIGFYYSYAWGVGGFLIMTGAFVGILAVQRQGLKPIWKRKAAYKGGLVLLLAAGIAVPLGLGVLSPVTGQAGSILYDPAVQASPSQPEVAMASPGDHQNVTVTVAAADGDAWNIVITAQAPTGIYVYVENLLNGSKVISYLQHNAVVEVPSENRLILPVA